MDTNAITFDKICQLACELEDTHIHPRVRQRLCNAYSRAIDKAMAINFSYEIPDEQYVQHTLFRHLERGARDFIP